MLVDLLFNFALLNKNYSHKLLLSIFEQIFLTMHALKQYLHQEACYTLLNFE